MGLYHITQYERFAHNWNISDTAEYFEVSKGLVSENIKLYKAIDNNIKLTELTREKALNKIK